MKRSWAWLGHGLAAVFIWCAAPTSAAPLPTCPAASPERISRPAMSVDQAWQRYRGLLPEHRCCAKVCEPIARLAAKIEDSTLRLYSIAAIGRLPTAAQQEVLRNASAMAISRGDLIDQFNDCLIATRPRVGTGGPLCGKPAAVQQPLLQWAKWCAGFTDRQRELDSLLVKTVGSVAGTWQFTANVKINDFGQAQSGSYEAVLPPGKSAKPLLDLIQKMQFDGFADGRVSSARMTFASKAVHVAGLAGSPFTISSAIAGPCPGKLIFD